MELPLPTTVLQNQARAREAAVRDLLDVISQDLKSMPLDRDTSLGYKVREGKATPDPLTMSELDTATRRFGWAALPGEKSIIVVPVEHLANYQKIREPSVWWNFYPIGFDMFTGIAMMWTVFGLKHLAELIGITVFFWMVLAATMVAIRLAFKQENGNAIYSLARIFWPLVSWAIIMQAVGRLQELM